jgi:hypothetical protein
MAPKPFPGGDDAHPAAFVREVLSGLVTALTSHGHAPGEGLPPKRGYRAAGERWIAAYYVCHPGELAALYHSLGPICAGTDRACHAALEAKARDAKATLYRPTPLWWDTRELAIRM